MNFYAVLKGTKDKSRQQVYSRDQRAHSCLRFETINKMTELVLSQNMNGNQEPMLRKWRKHCQISRVHFNARKPIQVLRAGSVEKISISLSIVKDYLPERVSPRNYCTPYGIARRTRTRTTCSRFPVCPTFVFSSRFNLR